MGREKGIRACRRCGTAIGGYEPIGVLIHVAYSLMLGIPSACVFVQRDQPGPLHSR